jgi:multisubunit Na+/H+ antiporter MnhE subunit
MINIFNLFLVLLFCWFAFAFAGGVLSWFYLFLGIVASAIISLISWRIKLIDRTTDFLFLNLGFYQHFCKLIFLSFFKSMFLLVRSTLKTNHSITYYLPIKKQNNGELALFISTISLIPGLFCLGIKDEELVIHALDEKYFKQAKINELYNNIKSINDNRLV